MLKTVFNHPLSNEENDIILLSRVSKNPTNES